MSLALAHKRRIQADGPAAARAGAEAMAYSSATALSSPANGKKHLKLMEDALAQDLERISAINSRELRQQLKRDELLPKYLDYVQRYRDSGLSFPNSVVMQVLVWLFDTAQFEAGLDLANFAMGQNQQLPERFKRDVPTFVADEVIDWAEAEYKAKRSPEPYLSDLLPLVDGEWKLFERIPARYHKQLGILALDQRDFAKAITHFERAEALYEGIGVGTRLEGARKALTKELANKAPE
ncbi:MULTISPECIES: phage terminase small subunit [Pseudomonas]|uniref:Tetratricopeptide (TPR) repeat protein n=1 Tax=Pseudomonas umsongensis TaxID=198618 RepID=A0ACC5M6Y3_9PSED|nr:MULTISPECIES: phage terminase small subunit [Pseudomonas]MBB2884449.1 tetratricopeptide (TPR) repeat protein [Pseudomonas umsongensis]NMN77013.1 small terminase subunit [Pseudomonas sp. KD5]